MVISLIGLSSSGKSTVGKELYALLRERLGPTVFLDGDEVRAAIAPELGFTEAEREESEARRSRLSKLLSDQGLNVVCAAISNSNKWQTWCRENIRGYAEVYLRVPMEVLEKRDKKGIYAKARRKETTNVVGYDIEFRAPTRPEIIVDNGGAESAESIAIRVFDALLSHAPNGSRRPG